MNPRDSHFSSDVLLDYIGGTLGDDFEDQVERHIAQCAQCASVARDATVFSKLIEMPAEYHAALVSRASIEGVLGKALAQVPVGLRPRIEAWLEMWSGKAEGALQITTNFVDGVASVVAESIDAFVRDGSEWSFQPVAATAVRGPGDEGSALLTTASVPGVGRARVAVQGGESTDLTVRIDQAPEDATLPLVALTGRSQDGKELLRIASIVEDPDTGYRTVRFADIPPGNYIVAIEPITDAKPA